MSARAARAAVVTLVVAAGLLLPASTASALSYRFWSYWHGTSSGAWAFSPVGATYRPAHGSVEGWRFAVSAATGSRTPPRSAASFSSVCGPSPAPEGRKRVALVVDFGVGTDAPPGQRPPRGIDTLCAEVAATATGFDVLQAYAGVRAERGLVCAIRGYPAGECGAAVVPAASVSPTPSRSASRPPTAQPGRSPATTQAPGGSASGAASPADSASAPSAVGSPSTEVPTSRPGQAADPSRPTPTPSPVAGSPQPERDAGSPLPAVIATLGLLAMVGAAAAQARGSR